MKKRIRRINITAILFALTFAALTGRMFYIQVVRHDDFSKASAGQYVIPFQIIEQEDKCDPVYYENADDTKPGYYYIVHRRQCGMNLTRTMFLIHGEPVGTKGKDYVIYKAGIYDKAVNRILKEKFSAYAFCMNKKIEDAGYSLVGNGCGMPIQGIGLQPAESIH